MIDPIQLLWSPAGFNLPALGARALVDVTDGDTPNIRMPVRMLSIDTPEVTARSEAGAARVDERFKELAQWMRDGIAPVTAGFRDHVLHKLETGTAGTLQFTHGRHASAFFRARADERLTRANGRKRNLFLRTADEKFDSNGRLLAYVAPSYSTTELREMSRHERSTFNLDMVESGWAAPFIIYPSIPGELDMPLFLEAAVGAVENGRGQHADPLHLPGYEYRMMERLHSITRKIASGDDLPFRDRIAWRERYCADMRDRSLHGPEDYAAVPGPYRIWIWPGDVQAAIGTLNLVPAGTLARVG